MGKLTVYTGPMKSGKTTELLKQYKQMEDLGFSCELFKPSIDNRFSDNSVIDRDNRFNLPSVNIGNIDELLKYTYIENLFIDEFQFLDGNICVIRDLLDLDLNLYVAGLNLTAERKPFRTNE